MSKILIVVGSGDRNGNTDQLCEAFMKGALDAGNEVEKVNLSGSIEGCMGCGACQKNGNHCVINDKMQSIYPMFDKADTVVLASPLYFWSISGRLKSFIDRLYAASTEDKYKHKNTVLLMTSGSKGFYAFQQAVSFYNFFTSALGWTDKGMVLARGCKGEIGKKSIDNEYLESAYNLGKSI